MARRLRVALIQYRIGLDWSENTARAEELLAQARAQGAELAVLPEMFICPYDMDLVAGFAEEIPQGRTSLRLSRWARGFGLALVGGSLPERDRDGRLYNTATLWDPQGNLLALHRKVHLFDVDLPGGVRVQESKVFSAGRQVTVCEVLGFRLGLAVCYDVRFPELFRLMALAGAQLVALPGAFNQVSGPAHWELSLRARAVDNTFFVAGVSGLAYPEAKYNSWGHSMLVEPFGQVLVNLGRVEGVAVGEVDPARVEDIRARLPLLSQRREDLYKLKLTDKD